MKKNVKLLSVCAVLLLVIGTFSGTALFSDDILGNNGESGAESPNVEPPTTLYTIFESDFQWASASKVDSPFWELRTEASRVSGYSDLDGPVVGVTVHHCAGTYGWADDPADGVNQVHKGNDWPGAAYDFIIGLDGTIYHGGPLDSLGWHAGDYRNIDNIAISFEGNFNEYHPNEEQYEAGGHLIAYLVSITSITDERTGSIDLNIGSFDDVTPHGSWGSYGCPGQYFSRASLEYYYNLYMDGSDPGEFVLDYWSVEPQVVEIGETLTIEGRVENVGGETEDIPVELYIDGSYTDTYWVYGLGPGETEWVSFQRTKDELGTYDVFVGLWDVDDYVWLDTWESGFEVVEPLEIEITSPADGQVFDVNQVTVEWIGGGMDYYRTRLNEGDWVDVGTSTSHTYTGLNHGTHEVNVEAVRGTVGGGEEQQDDSYEGTTHWLEVTNDIDRAQRFVPGGSILTRLELPLYSSDTSSNANIGIRGNDDSQSPSVPQGGPPLWETSVTMPDEGSWTWVSIDVNSLSITPGETYWITIDWEGGDGMNWMGSYDDDSDPAYSTDGGTSWHTSSADYSYAYRTFTTDAAEEEDDSFDGITHWLEITNDIDRAQRFVPDRSGITRLELPLYSRGDTSSNLNIGIRNDDDSHYPTVPEGGTPIWETSITLPDDGTYQWISVDVEDLELTPGNTYWISLDWEGGDYMNWMGSFDYDTDPAYSTDGGANWHTSGSDYTYAYRVFTLEDTAKTARDSVSFTVDTSDHTHTLYGFWPYWTDPADYEPDWNGLTHVAYFGLYPQADGTLDDSAMYRYEDVRAMAHANGVEVTISLPCFDKDTQDSILAYHRTDLANNIQAAMNDYNADGVNLDFEFPRETNSYTGESNEELFEELMQIIDSTLDSSYHVSFCIAGGVEQVYRNPGLAQYIDDIFMMGYDYHWSNAPTTGPVSPFDDPTRFDVTNSVNILRDYYPDNKIILGVPFYGYDWPCEDDQPGSPTTGSGTAVFMKDAIQNADEYGRNWDEDSNTPWYVYYDGEWRQCWYEDDESLGLKWDYVVAEGLSGTGYWALGYEHEGIWDVVEEKFSDGELTFDIELMDGWNFVSFNLATTDSSLETILEDPDYGISGNYDSLMYYDASVNEWLTYQPDRPGRFNNLENWNHLMGVWIRMIEYDVLTIQGNAPNSTDISLVPGWNMAGYPSATAGNSDLPVEVDKIGYFQASEEYNLAYDYEPASFEFSPGEGYWIHNPTDSTITWSVSWGEPEPPFDPAPLDGATDVDTNPTLSVAVEHEGGIEMDVHFYDASTDFIIGTDEGVSSGSRASVTWAELEYDTTYNWYAVAADGYETAVSDTWQFTTSPQEAVFVMHGWSLTPGVVAPGETVTISGEVENIGGEEDSVPVELYIDQSYTDTEWVTLGPGDVTTVTFYHSEEEVGIYDVLVGLWDTDDSVWIDTWESQFEVEDDDCEEEQDDSWDDPADYWASGINDLNLHRAQAFQPERSVLSRIELPIYAEAGTASAEVTIRADDGGVPSSTAMGTKVVHDLDEFPGYLEWVSISFDENIEFTPGDTYWITVGNIGDNIEWMTETADFGYPHRAISWDGGTTWDGPWQDHIHLFRTFTCGDGSPGDALEGKIIAIDPGHGGSDTGAVGWDPDPPYEKHFALWISEELRDLLESEGAEVVMTRDGDYDVSLADRCAIANNAGADIFVSVHLNSVGNEDVQGTETFYYGCGDSYSVEGKDLAEKTQARLVARLGTNDRGARADCDYFGYHLYVLANTHMPAILTESVFISNQQEYEMMLDEYWRMETAIAHFEGILNYFNVETTVNTDAILEEIKFHQTDLDETIEEFSVGKGTIGCRLSFVNENYQILIPESYAVEITHKVTKVLF